jgi:hypothetical protein
LSATTVTALTGSFPTIADVSIINGADGGLNINTNGKVIFGVTAVDISGGDLSVTGNFKATAKSFLIDHPTPEKKAQGMKLQYACLEGPENGVYVRGKGDTNDEFITLPAYWADLVHAGSITVQLTPMSPSQRLYVTKIEDNKVYVKDASAIKEVTTFFYIAYGERKDIDHLTVEY